MTTRLLDMVVADSFYRSEIPELLTETVAVLATNVADYLYAYPPTEWNNRDAFPCVIPPHEHLWIEAYHARVSCKYGFYLRLIPKDKIELFCENTSPSSHPALWEIIRHPRTEWLVYMVCIVEDTFNTFPKTLAIGAYGADDQGGLVGDPVPIMHAEIDDHARRMFTVASSDTKGRPMSVDQATKFLRVLMYTVFMTCSFMHTKNVTRRVIPAPPPPRKRNRHKAPRARVRYHVLNIEPMRQILHHEGRSHEVGLEKALHKCRGHFKVFTSDKPLFGKYVGRFWWKPHERGSSEAGVVLKDFDITPPPLQQAS